MKLLLMSGVAGMACGVALGGGTSSAPVMTTVLADGATLPGMPAGSTVQLYNPAQPASASPAPSISGNGTISVGAWYFTTAFSGTFLVTGMPDALEARNIPLTQAPGLPEGVVLGALGPIGPVNNSGRTPWPVALSGAGVAATNNSAFCVSSAGGNDLIYREGDQVPGLDEGVWFGGVDLNAPLASDDDHYAQAFSVTGTGVSSANDTVLWIGDIGAGTGGVVLREGDGVPGLAGVTFGALLPYTGAGDFSLVSGGRVVIRNLMQNAPPDTGNALFMVSTGEITRLARQNDAAPGIAGGLLGSPQAIAANSSGTVVFSCGLTGPGVTAANNWAVWRVSPGSAPALVLRRGSSVPPAGAVWSSVIEPKRGLLINDAGSVLVKSMLEQGSGGVGAGSDQCLHLIRAGQTDLIAREGGGHGDLPAGVVFEGTFTGMSMNNADQVLFSARLRGAGVTAGNDDSLWLWHPTRGLRLLAREGFPITFDGGATRTPAADGILTASDSGGGDGHRSGLSAAGVAVFRALFTDGSARVLMVDTALRCGAADLGRQGGIEGYDGLLDNNDFVVFIGLFFGQAPGADVGRQGGIAPGDGLFDNNDFVVYLNLFFGGC